MDSEDNMNLKGKRVIEADVFLVRDAEGRPRAALGMGPGILSDRPMLTFWDKKGHEQQVIVEGHGKSHDIEVNAQVLYIEQEGEENNAVLAIGAEGAPHLTFCNGGSLQASFRMPLKKSRLEAGAEDGGAHLGAALVLRDKYENVRQVWPTPTNGTGKVKGKKTATAKVSS